jgi:hypothetical protein
MLMGALFADAMVRDVTPEVFPRSVSATPGSYARLFLRAIGLRQRRKAKTPPRRKPPAGKLARRTHT